MFKALGKRVYYNEITPEQFTNLGFSGADDLGNMFQFYRDFEEICNSVRDLRYSKELNPELQSFKTWFAKKPASFPHKTFKINL